MSQNNIHANALAAETSPYLLQHKDNPVHWQPWSDATFAKAKSENKPVLLSIGYAACHWCHVMAHESFENPDIAELMNSLFINVKVDREERPDVDNIYQSALAVLGEHGGWPLTMFLTPDGEPYWGGTYFPAGARFGRPAFPDVLTAMSRTYHEQAETVTKNATAIKGALLKISTPPRGETLTIERLNDAAKACIRMVDPIHGGTMGAPKFPQPAFFTFLWNGYLRTGSPLFRNAVTVTLNRMCEGGIYDHLGGGFSRYSTDEVWLAPHFEKMLYDNALLIELMTEVWKESRSELYAERIAETIDWMRRDLTETINGDTAFASAFDADSEGEEGKFYVWSEQEIEKILGDRAPVFKEHYDVSGPGNWEHKNILRRTNAPEIDGPATKDALKTAREQLLSIRNQRIPPERDHKVLADWNGLAISALAQAGATFGRQDWIDAAISAYRFVLTNMTDSDRLNHTWCAGKPQHPGVLDDYAAMSRAALKLYELSADDTYLIQAQSWVALVEDLFGDEGQGYFMAARDTADVFTRSKVFADNAVPSGNGLLTEVFTTLYLITGDSQYLDRAQAQIEAFSSDQLEHLVNMPTLLNAFEMVSNARQLVIVRANDDDEFRDLWTTAMTTAGPKGTFVYVDADDALPQQHPAFGKDLVDGKSAAYLCQGGTCSLPITDAAELKNRLKVA